MYGSLPVMTVSIDLCWLRLVGDISPASKAGSLKILSHSDHLTEDLTCGEIIKFWIADLRVAGSNPAPNIVSFFN